MKNKEFYKLLKKNKSKPNSGFTLTELLIGVIMSTIVISALGFGVLQLLKITDSSRSKSQTASEASRTFSFIADEIKRAQSIEVDPSSVVGDSGLNLSSQDEPILAINLPDATNVTQPIIYYTAPSPDENIWRGPLVIYRWGPPLDAEGNYTNGAWQREPLVDNVDDVEQTINCGGNDVTYKGFFACVIDNDGDVDAAGNPIVEDAIDVNGDGEISFADDPADANGNGEIDFGDTLTDTNGDGTIDFRDSTLDKNQDGKIDNADGEDINGTSITAQLYFTGETEGIGNKDDGNYAAQTQVVARARTALDNNSDNFSSYTMSYKTLGAVYGCKPDPSAADGSGSISWNMRTDFITDSSTLDNEEGNRNKKWIHDETRQPQPIKIDANRPLLINSIPVNQSGSANDCISRGGKKNIAGEETIYDNESITSEADLVYEKEGDSYITEGGLPVIRDDIHSVSHKIDFTNPTTFNGYPDKAGDGDIYVKKNDDGSTDYRVIFLKPGDTVPTDEGYDVDGKNETEGDRQQRLVDFLKEKKYVGDDGKVNNKLGKDERIVIFEIGQTDTNHPGFDRQDNIFILSSDIFAKNFANNGATDLDYDNN